MADPAPVSALPAATASPDDGSPGPRVRAPGACDLSTICMVCGTPMDAEHAHYRCPTCGWRDSCCM